MKSAWKQEHTPQAGYLTLARAAALAFVLVLFLQPWLLSVGVDASGNFQNPDPRQRAQAILEQMTPEEKIGQLFLITFRGTNVAEETQIYDLLMNHHVGGVVLSAQNDNFVGPDNTVERAYQLVSELQNIAANHAQQEFIEPRTRTSFTPQYIPLFIAVAQEGDGIPNDQLLSGFTPLPNQMAIGATWDPSMAHAVGQVLGRELRAVGFNMLIGPSLDVLEVMQSSSGEDLGTRTFGSDPFWVGEMGKQYIAGVHMGSLNRVAVIAKHFPGRGSSDRPPQEEVATVRKSLEQLKQIELAPFFAVTGSAPSPEATTDGLLVSHIRYQGLSGNIRDITPPVSLDQTALEQQLMGLPEFSSWRQSGGIVVSDDLGSTAMRRFDSPSGASFDARQVAREAFLAGNDLLYVNNFVATGDPDTYTTIIRTLDFFAQKYREDPVFAQRVDASVGRILQQKLKLYPTFSIEGVIPPEIDLSTVGQSQLVTFQVAQKAATLLSPDKANLVNAIPRPPNQQDRIVFITDEIEGRQCSTCSAQISLPVDGLARAVLKLYGPETGDQVYQYNLKSYSYAQLQEILDSPGNTSEDSDQNLEEDLRSANWLVFLASDMDPRRPQSGALRQLLNQRPDLLRNKQVVVFVFGAPYFLDSTDISKLTAYYSLYGKSQPFIDIAARLLFQEADTPGALPITVPGLGYELITATSPDPDQVIPLSLDTISDAEASPTPTGTITVVPTSVPTFRVGDTLPLRTGVIYDHNHHQVPDGTVVRFIFRTGSEEGATEQQVETTTLNGVARASFRIQTPGLLQIRVESEPAMTSEILQLDVTRGEGAVITAIAPTPIATETPQPTSTATSPPPTPTLTPTPIPVSITGRAGGWMLSMLIVWGIAIGTGWVVRYRLSMRWAVRFGLLTAAFSITTYTIYYLAVQPVKSIGDESAGMFQLAIVIIIGSVIGILAGVFWQRQQAQTEQRSSRKVTSTE